MDFSMLSHDIMEMIWNEKVKIEHLDKAEKSARNQFPRVINELDKIFKNVNPKCVPVKRHFRTINRFKRKEKSEIRMTKEIYFTHSAHIFSHIDLIHQNGYEDASLQDKFYLLRDTNTYGFGGHMNGDREAYGTKMYRASFIQ